MPHNLQSSSLKSRGSETAAPKQNSSTNARKAPKTAGASDFSLPERIAKRPPDTGDSDGTPEPGTAPKSPSASNIDASRRPADVYRCQVARSVALDFSGEYATECGSPAVLVCEFCGPMCSYCAAGTFCYNGEHIPVAEKAPSPPPKQSRRSPKKLNEAIYMELDCAKCGRVRLAMPALNHRRMHERRCPICRVKGPVQYLALGYTHRPLPFYEKFVTGLELWMKNTARNRTPWDEGC